MARLEALDPRLHWICPEWTSGDSGVVVLMRECREENQASFGTSIGNVRWQPTATVSLSTNPRLDYKSCLGSNSFRNDGDLVMRCVSFFLMILAVAATSSVRGQQPAVGEALRDAARDAVLEQRTPIREERREARQERRDERQEARGDLGDDRELLRLAVIRALRDGDFGDRQSVREERREDRQEARQERRDERQEARADR